MSKLTLKDVDLKGKKVLARCDFNVPQEANLNIADDSRIRASLPTINYILSKKPKKLILISHLGRPDGKVVSKYSLKPVAQRLKELTRQEVRMLADCIGGDIQKEINQAKETVILLENLRFHPGEEQNEPNFSKALASLGDIYVNDAFGSAHRAHASTEGITHYLTSVAGLLLEKEIAYLGRVLKKPQKPFMLILGGAKVSDKLGVIENLLPRADEIIIGGGMCYTFLKAQGKQIGNSKLEKDKLDMAKEILEKAKKQKVKIFLPIDNIITEKIEDASSGKAVGENIPAGWMGVDIGPKTIRAYCATLKKAKTIVWNGPLGIFEIDAFASGTKKVAEFISRLKATTVIGGGDTASAIIKFGLENKMTHISTGGGACLEFLEGKTLPGIAALTDKNA
ncbi:MAG: phosphoglycerate kinase [Omnitrophica WOR_2 bacterium RIFCSPHIGHO2_02_FULL_45_21]|nr:MAG: phosphoglycerate kinase [Omnitrophica WOR_2 bacterium RIFCSPHIGHO2_02_FULL_45_21]